MQVVVYLTRVGLAISVLINVLLGGRSNQTFSARNWERKRQGKWHMVPVIDCLFIYTWLLIQKILTLFGVCVNIKNITNHCMESWVWWATHSQHHDCENLIDRMEIIENGKEEGREV